MNVTAKDVFDNLIQTGASYGRNHTKISLVPIPKDKTDLVNHCIKEIRKDINIPITEIFFDSGGNRNCFYWTESDNMYILSANNTAYYSFSKHRIVEENNKYKLGNKLMYYCLNYDTLYYSFYDETGSYHCDTGPAITTYSLKNDKRRLKNVIYKVNGRTVTEKSWNKKFNKNNDLRTQIQMEKTFKVFGKEFKIDNVNKDITMLRLVLAD